MYEIYLYKCMGAERCPLFCARTKRWRKRENGDDQQPQELSNGCQRQGEAIRCSTPNLIFLLYRPPTYVNALQTGGTEFTV